MRIRLLFLAVFLVLCNSVFAQIIGGPTGNGYMQGAWVEIGEQASGAFGATTAPAGYHTHTGGATWTTGGPLAEVYDYGHDGWSVGAPPLMGDYSYPGCPFEGWEIQINGGRAQQYMTGCGGVNITAGGTLTGSGLTTYSNTGGIAKVNWAGTFNYGGSSLFIKQETRVDTYANAVVVTAFLYNTTGTAVPGVYYWRSTDPDNDETWPGGSFTTNNMVNYQNDYDHRVGVTGTGLSATTPPLTLCTKDCRAVACVYNAWPLTITQDLAAVWNQTYGPPGVGAFYDVGVNHNGDIGIGLVYNLGTIAPGDSTVISYAYVFDGSAGIDENGAIPDPLLKIYNDTIRAYPDTIDACLYPGIDTLPVNVLFGDDKCWTWSHWTWSPSYGLAATTGVHNGIILGELPGGAITYTVSGTDSATGMYSCNRKVFFFTVKSCHTAWVNNPCVGDAITFHMSGDSASATYYWWGPGGFTSALHNPVIFPSSFADTGWYYVVKTTFGVHDTDSAHVYLHPLPVLNMTSDLPLCGTLTNTLSLSVTPDSAGETFLWTGPSGFTSTAQFPVITPFDSTGQGVYFVSAVSQFGCKNNNTLGIYAKPNPLYDSDRHLGCVFDTVIFNNRTVNADSFAWNFGDLSPIIALRDPIHIYSSGHKEYVVTLTAYNEHCSDVVSDTIDLRHSVHSIFHASPDTLCFGMPDTMINTSYCDMYGSTLAMAKFQWNFEDGTFATDSTPALHIFPPGYYPVTLTVTDQLNCVDSMKDSVYVIQLHINSLHDTLLCLSEPLPLYNTISIVPNIQLNYKYTWTTSQPNLNDTTVQIPNVWGIGVFGDTLTVTIPNVPPDACPTRDTITINSVRGKQVTNLTPDQVIKYGSSVQLNADSQVIYLWKPNDGTLNNSNINNPVATPLVTTRYTVYGYDINGCLDSAYVTIYVDSSMNEGIPTGFTPNGDGLNDVFRVVGIKYQHLVEMRVFNRWGQQVFYTRDREKGWDGTFNGVPQETGVYYYSIVIARPGGNGENITYKGDVTLIR